MLNQVDKQFKDPWLQGDVPSVKAQNARRLIEFKPTELTIMAYGSPTISQ